jgi:hypothetical protein
MKAKLIPRDSPYNQSDAKGFIRLKVAPNGMGKIN